jgi:competence protein ComEC
MTRIANFFALCTPIAILISCSLIWYAILTQAQSNILKVSFLNVGQGDAIFIESPSGKQVLIDAGANSTVLKELSNVMAFHDRTIDLVIATHPDLDHIGGLPLVLQNFTVSFIAWSGLESNTAHDIAFQSAMIAEKGINIVALRGQSFDLGDGAELKILFPDRTLPQISPNYGSIVALLTYGEKSFLFTGDSPEAIENYLVSLDGNQLDIDVLKVGHHGSKTSSSEKFIQYTSPEYAIISLGQNNKYGHPHEQVLDILRASGAQILRTDKSGRITIKTNGTSLMLSK